MRRRIRWGSGPKSGTTTKPEQRDPSANSYSALDLFDIPATLCRSKLGRYEVTGVIGKAEVHGGTDTRLDRPVAVKVSSRQFNDRFERGPTPSPR